MLRRTVVLLAALQAVAATNPSALCVALSELVSAPPTLDSIAGADVERFGWVNTACNNQASTFEFDSGLIAGNVSFPAFPSATVGSVQVRQSVTATVTGSALDFNISLSFQ